MSKLANRIEKVVNITTKLYFYFYLALSIISITLYYLNYISAFKIVALIMISIYIIELLLGFDRNLFGFIGIFISGLIGYMLLNNFNGILLGISFGILIINIIKRILNFILNIIIKSV